MDKRRGGRGSKYSDEFKRQLVLESRAVGVSVAMVSRQHNVPSNRIYAWRGDARFQPDGSDPAGFTAVAISNDEGAAAPATPKLSSTQAASTVQIEITLENGRRLRVSDDVDAGFVLALARGLAA